MTSKGNPFQTGGGGTNFEQYVQAAYLLTLIIRGNAPCLPSNEVSEVAFQTSKRGYATDDLLVICQSTLGEHRLIMQCKHDLSFTLGNEKFKKVIGEFWSDFNNNQLFNPQLDKLIFVKNGLTRDERSQIKTLFNWANTHSSEVDFFNEVEQSETKKTKLEIFKISLKEANGDVEPTNLQLWQFLKCLDVLEYDLLNNGSIDLGYFLNLIRLSKKVESTTNDLEIWNTILAFAGKLNFNGGSATTESIVREDFYQDFSLESLNTHFKAVEKLRDDGRLFINQFKECVGDIQFKRDQLKEDLLTGMVEKKITIITGKPGVGKSALLKAFLNEQTSLNAFIFRADQFNQPQLSKVLSSEGINTKLSDLFSCLSLLQEKILILDSLEKLLEADPECSFKQLINFLESFPDIKIIATSRKYAIDLILNKYGIQRENTLIIDVPVLEEFEMRTVVQAYPKLEIILNNPKIYSLLRSPKYLDYSIRAFDNTSIESTTMSITDFKNVLWNTLIVDESTTTLGMPIKRERAFMEIAVKRAKLMKLFTSIVDSDPEAVTALERDEIVFSESQKRNYAPSHDILEDWALVRYVSNIYEDYPDPLDLFQQLGNEPAIRRAFRLWVEDLLIDDSTRINNLISNCINNSALDEYWSNELLIAVFKSENGTSFFESFKDLLLQDKKLLNRCLRIIKTCCKEGEVSDNNGSLIPIGSGWADLLLFIQNHLTNLEDHRYLITQFLLEWQYRIKFHFDATSSEELLAAKCITLYYIKQIESGDDFWRLPITISFEPRLISLLIELAPVAKEEIKQFVDLYYSPDSEISWEQRELYKKFVKGCLSGIGNDRLVKVLPDMVIDLAWKEWKLVLPEIDEGDELFLYSSRYTNGDECWGIRDRSSFFPSGIYKTPFVSLLTHHSLQALKFITEFLNYSIDFYIQSDYEYKRDFQEITIQLNSGELKKQWGASQLWEAYRGTEVTHYGIECILMSLEQYLYNVANEQTSGSRQNLHFCFEYLLTNSNSVLTTSVLASIIQAFPREVSENMFPILRVHEFYEWDIRRHLNESKGLTPYDDKIPFAQNQRWESNDLPHRKKYYRGLVGFIIDYQFNIRTFNAEIFEIIDSLIKKADENDLVWRKMLHEMDIRTYKVGEYNEKSGGYLVEPVYDKALDEFIDSNSKEAMIDSTSIENSQKVSKMYEGKLKLDYKEWASLQEYYSSNENFNLLFDRPATCAILGIKDFKSQLSESQGEWCYEILSATMTTVIQKIVSHDYSSIGNYNSSDKDVVLSSFHLLLEKPISKKDHDNIIMTMIYLVMNYNDLEAKKVNGYLRSTFFELCPEESMKLWNCLIHIARYKRENRPVFYRTEEERITAYQNEFDFIKLLVEGTVDEIDIFQVTFETHDASLIAVVFCIIPFTNATPIHVRFIDHFTKLFIEDLALPRDYSSIRPQVGASRQISHSDFLECQKYFIQYLLFSESERSKITLEILFDLCFDKKTETSNRQKELADFVDQILERVIYLLDEQCAKLTNQSDKNHLINNFWRLWKNLLILVKKSGKSDFNNLLLLNVSWSDKAENWLPLEGKQNEYLGIVKELGDKVSTQLIKVFSTIGTNLFLPQGLKLIVDSCKKDPESIFGLMTTASDRLVERLFHRHIMIIKKDKLLLEDYIWLLNMMVDLGSSNAYLFRENVITYRTVN